MKTTDMIQSKFIRKEDLMDAPMVLTISDCTMEDSNLRRGAQQPVLWFEETPKGLGLNNTKVRVLEAAYGIDSETWEGLKVRLSYDPSIKMGPALVGGIKLETPKVKTAPKAPPGAPPPPVWDPATNQWIVVQPAPALAPAPVAAPTAATGFGPPPPTLAQRMAATPPASGDGFDDDIPF